MENSKKPENKSLETVSIADLSRRAYENALFSTLSQAEAYVIGVVSAPSSKGRQLCIKYLSGERLSRGQALLVKCFDCCGFYTEGRNDCGIKYCSGYPYMPYRLKK